MNFISTAMLKKHQHLQRMVRCAVLHKEGYTNKDIADELGITPVEVSRALSIARDERILKSEVYPPLEEEAVVELLQNYTKHYLREAYVFDIGVETEIINILGGISAAYVENLLDEESQNMLLFTTDSGFRDELNNGNVSNGLLREFEGNEHPLIGNTTVRVEKKNTRWLINDESNTYAVTKRGEKLRIYNRIDCIAMGPGRASLVFARALSDKRRPEMRVSATTAATTIETYMASNIIIGIPAGKWECELNRFDPELSCKEEQHYEDYKGYADVFIFGIERVPDMDGVTAWALISENVAIDDMRQELSRLACELGGVGIINYQPIDKVGNPIKWNMKAYRELLEPTALHLNVIREIAKDEKKRVICIGGGADNAEAIRAGLLGGYFNVLITDYEAAKAILRW